MVEIVKGETSNSYSEPGILPKRAIAGNTGFAVITGRNKRVVEKSSNFLNPSLNNSEIEQIIAGLIGVYEKQKRSVAS